MSAIRRSRKLKATTHRPHRGGTGLWRSRSCSSRYPWLGAGCVPVGRGAVAELTAFPCSTGHAQGQVWGRGGHAADEANHGGWEDGPRRLPCQVHSAPPHRRQVVGRVCSVPARVAGVCQRLLGAGGLSGGEQHPSADFVCLAGASTPHMTTHTASVTPSNTSPTPSAPRSSRPGEHHAQHGPGLAALRGSSCQSSERLWGVWGCVCASLADVPPTSGCATRSMSTALCSGSTGA